MRILFSAFISALTLAMTATTTAQVSPFVEAQVQAAIEPCNTQMAKVTGMPDTEAKPIVVAALPDCYAALRKLDTFEKTNLAGMSANEINYFYYAGGNTIWLTAGGEVMKNDGNLTPNICGQVKAAESTWSNVKLDPESPIFQEMLNNELRSILLPACLAALKAQQPQPAEPPTE